MVKLGKNTSHWEFLRGNYTNSVQIKRKHCRASLYIYLNSEEYKTNSSFTSEPYIITILNANGTTVITETSEQELTQYNINVSKLPSGMYFLMVQSDKKTFKQNFIKQ